MKKNICLLIYDLRSGGAERVLSQWSTLLNNDFNVCLVLYDKKSVIAYQYSGRLSYLDVPSDNRNTLTKIFIVLKRARLLKKFVNENEIDLVLSFGNECNLVNTISRHNAKKICSIRSASDLYSNPFVKIVVYSRHNIIIIQTEALKNMMSNLYGEKILEKIIVFGNPFNIEDIRKAAVEKSPEEIREVLAKKKTIVNVASFKPQKNHANLLRSFEIVCEKEKDVYLLLIGADSSGIKEKVLKMAEESKYSDRIIFVGELKNPFAVISKATIFVLPSLSEGMPNALAEAMICGLPVISTNCPTGPAELLCENIDAIKFDSTGCYEGEYGLLVKPFDKVADYNYETFSEDNMNLATAMVSLLNNEVKRERMKTNAIEGAKKFNIERYKDSLINLIYSFFE